MLRLEVTKRTDPRLLRRMREHYSQPRGFVGRNRCFAVSYRGVYYGHIVAGSATLHLPGREAMFSGVPLKNLVGNIFFSVSHDGGGYPLRNFTTRVVAEWRKVAADDWYSKYGDEALGWETLVEPPRTGELYLRDGWVQTGVTKGFTCRRVGGTGSDSWSGKRVWDTQNLRPKLVLSRFV